jgi:hypothetical protein
MAFSEKNSLIAISASSTPITVWPIDANLFADQTLLLLNYLFEKSLFHTMPYQLPYRKEERKLCNFLYSQTTSRDALQAFYF